MIARTESHGRTERWCLPLSRVGYCNAALAPLSFPLASPFLMLSLCSPCRWLTFVLHSSPPPARLPPRDHRRSCTSILCDSPFSIYFPRFAPRFPLQMSPRGRLTFVLTALSSPSLLRDSISLSFFFTPLLGTRFSRLFDWRETLDHRLAINHSPSRLHVAECIFSCYSFSGAL